MIRKITLVSLTIMLFSMVSFGQNPFIDAVFDSTSLKEVVLPKSPITSQVLFIGSVDSVEVVDSNGDPAGKAPAKEWHDFIGFTPDTASGSDDLGWVTVNHEMWASDPKIGDGGGCTSFKVKRGDNDTIVIVEQTLPDGRKGKFFNVDFVNTTGNTGANCGGMVSPVDGRIWTAEEWWLGSNSKMAKEGFSDTNDFEITGTGIAAFDGKTVERHAMMNYMVEVDPRTAKAVRKQYNWGRQPYEGGCILNDNKTVFTGSDATPGILTKFVADVAGDFTSGTTYVYAEDKAEKWIEIDNASLETMLYFTDSAAALGATLFNRLEWVAYDKVNEMVYITETGRDDTKKPVAKRMEEEIALGGKPAQHLIDLEQTRFGGDGQTLTENFQDYYGRILKLNPSTSEVTVHLEGGPYFSNEDVAMSEYPSTHLSNPDGISVMHTQGKQLLLVCEDLNGMTHGRIPSDYYYDKNRVCEFYLLDLEKTSPTVDDLRRIAVVPTGAEVTGAIAIDDNTILVDVQHPSTSNTFPYNHSLTMAFTGWNSIDLSTASIEPIKVTTESGITIYPNPAVRQVFFSDQVDVELYDMKGALIMSESLVDFINVSNLTAGSYIIKTGDDIQKLVIK
ncbi:MAG: DUF839 domain-containing protein [Bacteroidales bacterium]|nr:DUF839 domain-containing protein [Bacteroidales bacterium]